MTMGDEFEESEFEDETEEDEFQEAGGEGENVLKKRQEVVFCPYDGEYLPYKVKGAIVVRKCPKCKREFYGGG